MRRGAGGPPWKAHVPSSVSTRTDLICETCAPWDRRRRGSLHLGSPWEMTGRDVRRWCRGAVPARLYRGGGISPLTSAHFARSPHPVSKGDLALTLRSFLHPPTPIASTCHPHRCPMMHSSPLLAEMATPSTSARSTLASRINTSTLPPLSPRRLASQLARPPLHPPRPFPLSTRKSAHGPPTTARRAQSTHTRHSPPAATAAAIRPDPSRSSSSRRFTVTAQIPSLPFRARGRRCRGTRRRNRRGATLTIGTLAWRTSGSRTSRCRLGDSSTSKANRKTCALSSSIRSSSEACPTPKT